MLRDWPKKNPHHFFHPIRSETKTNRASFAHVFPRFVSATRISSEFWLVIGLCVSFVIGYSDYLGFGFTTLTWKPLKQQQQQLKAEALLLTASPRLFSEYAKVQQHLNLWLPHARGRSRRRSGNGFHFSWWSRILQNRWFKLRWTSTQIKLVFKISKLFFFYS